MLSLKNQFVFSPPEIGTLVQKSSLMGCMFCKDIAKNIAKKFPRKITDTFILRPVPLLGAWLAGQHGGPAGVLPRHAARDRTRHHLLLGRQDGLLRAEAHGQAPLQGCLPTRHGERDVKKLTLMFQLFIFLGRCETPTVGRCPRAWVT